MLNQNIKWIFFDVGSTLIDETEAYNHRIRDSIEGTDITFEEFNEKRIFFAKQNLKGELEAIKYFELKKLRGIQKMRFRIKMQRRFWNIYLNKDIKLE